MDKKSKNPEEIRNTFIDISGIENFRDFGGYRTQDGRWVKKGRFYRSGAFTPIDDRARSQVEGLGIRNILDYRIAEEVGERVSFLPKGASYHQVAAINKDSLLPASGGDESLLTLFDHVRKVESQEEADFIYEHFKKFYEGLPFDNPAYKKLFSFLDDESHFPLVHHCSAGKDRTGVGSALILLALGVDKATVIKDYMLSAWALEAKYQNYVKRLTGENNNSHLLEVLELLVSVKREMIQISLEALEEKYPSFEDFYREEYGIGRERIAHWRELHLQGL